MTLGRPEDQSEMQGTAELTLARTLYTWCFIREEEVTPSATFNLNNHSEIGESGNSVFVCVGTDSFKLDVDLSLPSAGPPPQQQQQKTRASITSSSGTSRPAMRAPRPPDTHRGTGRHTIKNLFCTNSRRASTEGFRQVHTHELTNQ